MLFVFFAAAAAAAGCSQVFFVLPMYVSAV